MCYLQKLTFKTDTFNFYNYYIKIIGFLTSQNYEINTDVLNINLFLQKTNKKLKIQRN